MIKEFLALSISALMSMPSPNVSYVTSDNSADKEVEVSENTDTINEDDIKEAKAYGMAGFVMLPDRQDGNEGGRVFVVFPDSIAEKAGLKEEDVVLEIDGVEVKGKNGRAFAEMGKGKTGDKMVIKFKRKDEVKEITLVRESLYSYMLMVVSFVETFGDGNPKAALLIF